MKLSIFRLLRETVNWGMSQGCDTNISIHIMSRRPNIWMLQREQCLPKSDETSKPVYMWFKNADGNVIVSTVTCVWTHEHMMVSYETDILVCLLSPALHPRGDACLSPAVCSAADPRLGLPPKMYSCVVLSISTQKRSWPESSSATHDMYMLADKCTLWSV